MYKILLADEEGVALRALRVMIDADYAEDCDIRLVGNAQKLTEIYQKFQPDILFLNVQMPGIHGISTIRELHTKNRTCQFIIVSYSNKIDYGREGKYMGIFAYIAKPYKQDSIRTLMKNCFAHITTEHKRDEITRYNQQKWEEAVPMIEGGLISEILFPDEHSNNIPVYTSFLNIKYDYAWLCTLNYGQINEHGTMCNPIGSVVQLSNVNPYFRRVIKAFFPSAIVGPILGSNVTFLVPCKDPHLTEEEQAIRKKRVDDLTYQLHKKLNLRFRSTIGSPFKL